MENQNSPEYLEKIKIQVIENLKKTTFAPSVQMQEVPRDSLMGDLDEEDDRLDDADEDENMDTRHTQRRSDKHIERADELYDSDDEAADRDMGIHSNGTHKERNQTTHKPISRDDEMDVDSSVPTPDAQPEVENATPIVTETNAQVNDEVMQNKQLDVVPAIAEAGPSNAPSRADSIKAPEDTEDVEMNDVEDIQPVTEAQATANPPPIPTPAVPAAATNNFATPPSSPPQPASTEPPTTIEPVSNAETTIAPTLPSEAAIQATTTSPKQLSAEPTIASATSENARDAAREAGEAERVDENVTAEATTEIELASQK